MASEYDDPDTGVRTKTWPDVPVDQQPPQDLKLFPKPSSAGKVDEPSLPVWKRVGRWFFSPNAYPLKLFIASRVFFIGITYSVLALLTVGHEANRGVGVTVESLYKAWDQWDATWYIGIASQGYGGFKPVDSSAFFPLMPFAMKMMAEPLSLVHDKNAYLLAGMLVSNLAFLGAGWVFYALVRQEFNTAIAQRALLYFMFFPKALFTFAPYSESLFLLVFIASYYFLRRKQFALAGLFAGLAMLGRFFGVILVLPFVIELAWYCRKDVGKWFRYGWSLVAIPAALGVYMLVLYLSLGNPLAFLQAEAAHWNRHFVEPIQTLLVAVVNVRDLHFGSTYQLDRLFDLVIVFAELAFLIAALTPWGLRRFRVPFSMTLLSLGVLLIPLSDPFTGYLPGYIASISRLMLPAIGFYCVLARFTERRPRWHEVILVFSVGFLVVFTAGFVLGDYVI
jgi:hypothetical protein